MNCSKNSYLYFTALVTMYFSTNVLATNGMNLEGYGPIATAMGGASMAYDNGNAAAMNNPATLGLMNSNHRFEFALGNLRPSVTAIEETNNLSAESSATSFFMPAIGWAMKSGKLTYGLGVFSQGGMGTEYGSSTWLSNPGQQTTSPELINRSEVGVGRALIPLSYQVLDNLIVGGSVDFVWAGMDLKMGMNEAQFQDLANPMSQQAGTASGTLVQGFGGLYEPFGGSGISRLDYAYFDFSNDSDFTGAAMGTGFAGKLGLTYQLHKSVSIGATYHSKTSLNDLETSKATMTMAVNADTGIISNNAASAVYADMAIPVSGKISVNNFEWPSSIGVGIAVTPIKPLLVVADIKHIGWSDVMQEFSMTFTADNVASNGNFAGASMDMALFQKWENQIVVSLGAAYALNDALTLRGGANIGNNPVPSKYLNALFPAIVKNHITAGAGYTLGSSAFDFSLTVALQEKDTNAGNVSSEHSQLNWQIMYSYVY